MKQILLFSLFIIAATAASSQGGLPAGKYETTLKQSQNKWQQGDIILLDDSHYKISSSNEIGEYRFSATAQRIFFTSGPLKTVFAKTVWSSNKPAIVIPAAENEQQGLKLASADIVGAFKN